MSMKKTNKRYRSKIRVRKKITGTPERPRLSVYRSLDKIYAQVIDDTAGITLVSASSGSTELKAEIEKAKGKISKSKLVGSLIAKKAVENNINTVVFDRNGYRYHGRIKAVAEGAREGGLKF